MAPGLSVLNYVDYPQIVFRDLVSGIATCSGRALPRTRVPLPVAWAAAALAEAGSRVVGRTPVVTRGRVLKLCAATEFRADRIRELGFVQPHQTIEGLRVTMEWNRKHGWNGAEGPSS